MVEPLISRAAGSASTPRALQPEHPLLAHSRQSRRAISCGKRSGSASMRTMFAGSW